MLAFRNPTVREAALRAENRLLRSQLVAVLRILRGLLGNRPIPFTNDQRADIARAADACSTTAGTVVVQTSLLVAAVATVRGWFRNLVQRRARKTRTALTKRVGRPRIAAWIERLVCAMARRCPTWGYARIAGMVAAVRGRVSKSTVKAILRRNGIAPSRERTRRNRQWKAFCAAHWTRLAACDAFTVPVLTLTGWKRTFVLVVIHLATRRIHIAAVTQHPDSAVMANVARQLSMEDGLLARWNARVLIHDGDGAFTRTGFDAILATGGITVIRTAPRSPNMNAYAERVIRSIQKECTDRFWFLGERALRGALTQYVDWYHHHRPHQGIGNRIIDPGTEIGSTDGPIVMRSRLAGTLVHWERKAA